MGSKFRRSLAVTAMFAMLSVGLVSSPSNANEVIVPKQQWPACSAMATDFCVESVKVQSIGGATLDLSYVSSSSAFVSSSENTSPSVSPVATTPRLAGGSVSGVWTHPDWFAGGFGSLGYDGLSIDIKTANLFTNDIFFTVLPGMFDLAGNPFVALRADASAVVLNLDLDTKVTLTARIGAVKTGVSIGVANSLVKTTTLGTEANPGKLVLSGTPVPVPRVLSDRQCEGKSGVASAVSNTMQGYIVVDSETAGFGVDGLSGRMAISSNGVACGASTPVWDAAAQTLTWQAGAPHFAPDGITPNVGFYTAVIPANDALLLWGLQDPARVASALQVRVISEAGGTARVASSRISYLYGNIVIQVTGFEFSRPKIQIKKIDSYQGFAKPRNLTCIDPVTKKRINLQNIYGCPKPPSRAFQTFVTPSFANTTSSLNPSHQRAVAGYLASFPEANRLTCIGIHAQNATRAQRIVAKKRADAICNFVRSKDTVRALTVLSEAKPSAAPSFQGRVMVTMRDDK